MKNLFVFALLFVGLSSFTVLPSKTEQNHEPIIEIVKEAPFVTVKIKNDKVHYCTVIFSRDGVKKTKRTVGPKNSTTCSAIDVEKGWIQIEYQYKKKKMSVNFDDNLKTWKVSNYFSGM